MDMYLTLKTFHIISFTAWFAGLFYLPRLFVYHVEQPQATATLTIMERKLARYIMRPAAFATVFSGIGLLLAQPFLLHMGWIHLKLTLIAILLAYHATLEYYHRHLAKGTNRKSGRFFRFYNEVPTLILIVVVTLAVFKPF
ncbi:MAG: protoporphyrinogen oxidase HemJ [Pseudomonadaceae bacterium]|nr:protoporphyrinogen oxidase HemJ [Pseudomonadaceae bacterium]